MSQANERLRAARELVESPNSPGLPMTRQELAEAVNEQVYRASMGTHASPVDANHIGKWERGVIRWPAARYRAALRAILDAGTDQELGFVRPSRGKPTGGDDDVDRKRFLKAALGVGAGALVPRCGFAATSDRAELAAALSGPTAHYRRMEQAVSSRQLAPAVAAHLTLARHTVEERLRTSKGFAVLSEIAGLAAWLAVDQGDQGSARRHYTDAVRYAGRAHHPLLATYMTASLGHFAVEAGDARQGLVLLQRAETQMAPPAPSSARAWLASLHAVAHAELRDIASAHAALRKAESLAGRQSGEPVWPWVFTFDTAKVARYQATTFARLGDVRAATTAFQAATPALTGPKPRALALLDHARVLARSGHVGDGCALATEALRLGRDFGSERVTAGVRAFRAGLPSRASDTRELDDQLTALYEENAP